MGVAAQRGFSRYGLSVPKIPSFWFLPWALPEEQTDGDGYKQWGHLSVWVHWQHVWLNSYRLFFTTFTPLSGQKRDDDRQWVGGSLQIECWTDYIIAIKVRQNVKYVKYVLRGKIVISLDLIDMKLMCICEGTLRKCKRRQRPKLTCWSID